MAIFKLTVGYPYYFLAEGTNLQNQSFIKITSKVQEKLNFFIKIIFFSGIISDNKDLYLWQIIKHQIVSQKCN